MRILYYFIYLRLKNFSEVLALVFLALTLCTLFGLVEAFRIPETLWILTSLFSLFHLTNVFAPEKESDALSIIISSSIEPWVLFLGKCIASFIYLEVIFNFTYLFWVILYQKDFSYSLNYWLIGHFYLAGLTSTGTFVASLVCHSRLQEVLFPLLFYPLLMSLFLAVCNIQITEFNLLSAWGYFLWGIPCIMVSLGILCAPFFYR